MPIKIYAKKVKVIISFHLTQNYSNTEKTVSIFNKGRKPAKISVPIINVLNDGGHYLTPRYSSDLC